MFICAFVYFTFIYKLSCVQCDIILFRLKLLKMALPQFPSQDLAKLVLGYLAEEQLMTAYDEFLQASPYLDALRNEYDRIFMTSLKNILAEYRAVKIYVETCKPFVLRKKLFQFTNLLDVVKFLVTHVDVQKIQAQEVDNVSAVKQKTSTKSAGCDVCNSLTSCTCKRQSDSSVHTSHVQTSTLESSVETTALEDLPGHHVATRKKHIRVLEKETILLESNLTNSLSTKHSSSLSSNSGQSISNSTASVQIKSSESLQPLGEPAVKTPNTPECEKKIEEFNSILSKVCKGISSVDKINNATGNEESRLSNTMTFQDFASGVCEYEKKCVPVPDSSTSECGNVLNTKEIRNIVCSNTINLKTLPSNETMSIDTCKYPRTRPKPLDQKVRIISDIKVDHPYNNATSTPLTQTIVINGTPAYKTKPPVPNNHYTKDEIMAMPTIIFVPASGKSKPLPQPQFAVAHKLTPVTNPVPSTRTLGPLVIDVSSSPSTNKTVLNIQQAGMDTGLVKTVDGSKNASVPKDNTVSCGAETNTPQVLPPLRKSSSTPRRNSHIRVLDFTTPRRILHETRNEIPNLQNNDKPTDTTITQPDKIENQFVDMKTIKVHKKDSSSINFTSAIDSKKTKRNNWDADLRALALGSGRAVVPVDKAKKKSKKVDDANNQKKKVNDKGETKKPRPKKKALSPKGKKTKRKAKVDEEEDGNSVNIIEGNVNVSIKPSIKIIPGDKYGTQEVKKANDNTQNNSNNDDANETPEAERIALQNAIGVKLNISELLETPYKQALYDIQMETPKFLGPDIPGEPISDVKIMNIPTPRFFDTPKPAQATPSSYSSRPTDYSSGGSYYKPDDQDYIPIPDYECPVSSSEPGLSIDPPKNNDGKKCRPVRQCTKNVSYFNSTTVSNKPKEKETDEKIEIGSSCSDSTVGNTSFEKKENNVRTPSCTKIKSAAKSETKKRVRSSKKYKSPIKKANTFMKIKPRRPTPIKENYTGKNKRKSDGNLSKTKRKGNCKEKNIHTTTAIATPAPTKSRRKSSTPRKLHCTKTFNCESSGHDSPEINATNVKETVVNDRNLVPLQDSDTEHIALRWSDDGSQDTKLNDITSNNEIEDITKIQEYIKTTAHTKPNYTDGKGAFHNDLIKRGFDAETAKIIERDLLDTPPHVDQHHVHCHVEIIETIKDDLLNKSVETNTSSVKDLQIDQDSEEDQIELSIHDCNVESTNYVSICHDDTKDIPRGQPTKLKDKFSMEVCIDDEVTVRLRANDFSFLFDHDPSNIGELGYSFRETEVAVSSITNIEKLYTPLKDQTKTTCYDIFDSTLTSLDTPIKPNSPKSQTSKATELEVVVVEEPLDGKEKSDYRKRKRLPSNSPEQHNTDVKKTKSEAQYLFNSTNIQNIDIESVLKKLHGP